jgi:hypothetical protein
MENFTALQIYWGTIVPGRLNFFMTVINGLRRKVQNRG